MHVDEQQIIEQVYDGIRPASWGEDMFSESDKVRIAREAWDDIRKDDPEFHLINHSRLINVVDAVIKTGSSGVVGLEKFEARAKEIIAHRIHLAKNPPEISSADVGEEVPYVEGEIIEDGQIN